MFKNQHRKSSSIVFIAAAFAAGTLFTSCGGDASNEGDTSNGGTSAGDVSAETSGADNQEAGDTTDQDNTDDDGGEVAHDAHATVVLDDGTTYEFLALIGGASDGFASLCTTVMGSLQGMMPLVDESGAVIEDGELSFMLFDDDTVFADDGESTELQISVPTDGASGMSTFVATDDDIDAVPQDRSASGTFTARDSYENEISGTVEINC